MNADRGGEGGSRLGTFIAQASILPAANGTEPILLLDRSHTEKILRDYVRHFNDHRPHQGRNQLAPNDDPTVIPLSATRVQRRHAVGGLIYEYLAAS
ncbi:hypothetical protein [Dactylosporangium sp. CA-139066]|uniref:hypothetical protein n=1 Tax=Dactylosporangium sp. CA-139066 TaxID=3239930 RepID=UPI003D8BBA92